MDYVVKTRSKRTRHFIEHIMPSMIKQLGLTNSRKTVLIDVTRKFNGEGNASYNLTDYDFKIIFNDDTSNFVKIPLFSLMRNSATSSHPQCNVLVTYM